MSLSKAPQSRVKKSAWCTAADAGKREEAIAALERVAKDLAEDPAAGEPLRRVRFSLRAIR